MNIIVISNYHMFDNLSTSFVFSQAAAYVRLGHRVRIIIPTALGKQDCFGHHAWRAVTFARHDGVEFAFVRFLSLSNLGERSFNKKSVAFAVTHSLKKLLDGFSPDVIHAHALTTSVAVGICLKKQLGIPLVVTTHGGDTFVPFSKGQFSDLKRCADQADHLVCVSSLLKQRMQDCKVIAPMSVILNGFNIRHAAQNEDKPPFSMVQAGFLIARKKANVTIQALALLRKRFPGVTLDIVGSGGESDRLKALCGELGVSEAVRFHGFLPNSETMEKMSKARFFVMPSINEGFGIVYLEAMACGCVTIGTEGEGIADLIVSGKNGFLVPPDDPGAIARTIEWCLEHPEEASAIAEEGRRDALGMTWERNAEQYIKLFKELQHGNYNSDRKKAD